MFRVVKVSSKRFSPRFISITTKSVRQCNVRQFLVLFLFAWALFGSARELRVLCVGGCSSSGGRRALVGPRCARARRRPDGVRCARGVVQGPVQSQVISLLSPLLNSRFKYLIWWFRGSYRPASGSCLPILNCFSRHCVIYSNLTCSLFLLVSLPFNIS